MVGASGFYTDLNDAQWAIVSPLLPAVRLSEMGVFVTCRAVSLRERHQPCAKQLATGATVHRSLEHLQPVDLAFDRPVARALRNHVDDFAPLQVDDDCSV